MIAIETSTVFGIIGAILTISFGVIGAIGALAKVLWDLKGSVTKLGVGVTSLHSDVIEEREERREEAKRNLLLFDRIFEESGDLKGRVKAIEMTCKIKHKTETED